jgi:hypothetical protein
MRLPLGANNCKKLTSQMSDFFDKPRSTMIFITLKHKDVELLLDAVTEISSTDKACGAELISNTMLKNAANALTIGSSLYISISSIYASPLSEMRQDLVRGLTTNSG